MGLYTDSHSVPGHLRKVCYRGQVFLRASRIGGEENEVVTEYKYLYFLLHRSLETLKRFTGTCLGKLLRPVEKLQPADLYHLNLTIPIHNINTVQ